MPDELLDGGEGEQRGFIPRHLRSWIHPSERRGGHDDPEAGSGAEGTVDGPGA